MTPLQRRAALLVSCLLGAGIAAGLSLRALKDNLVYFVLPHDLVPQSPTGSQAGLQASTQSGRMLRLGGMVQAGSVRPDAGAGLRFRIADAQASVPVHFVGIVPDLFREGQGVVALGRLGADGVFEATQLLARHDETYMPRDVAQALRQRGEWRPEKGAAPPARQWNRLFSSPASAASPRPGQ